MKLPVKAALIGAGIILIVIILYFSVNPKDFTLEGLAIELTDMCNNIFAPETVSDFNLEREKWLKDSRMTETTHFNLFGPTVIMELTEIDKGRDLRNIFTTIGYSENQSDGIARILIAMIVNNTVTSGKVRVDVEFYIDEAGNILGVDRRQT